MTDHHLPLQVFLRKNEDRRVVRGHPWVFSNEIREIVGQPAIGDVVEVLSAGRKTVGVGFYNPHSLIAVRLLSRAVEEIDVAFLRGRIVRALELRQALYPDADAFRLVHGESDFLPGLVIDKFGDHLAVQTVSFGMDARLSTLCDILEELLHPAAIIERNETSLRTMEHLPLRHGVLRGTPAPAVIFSENGIRYSIDPLKGQKTGFFLDQRENRAIVARLCRNARVLDCYCNDGGFSLNAAKAGAASVLGVDSSAEAVEAAARNAADNGLKNVTFQRQDAPELLAKLTQEDPFDVVILDPPSFTRNRKTVPAARQGYRELNARALRLVRPGGYLATASCSHHIEPQAFLEDCMTAGRKSGKQLQLLEWRAAPPDHPTLPSVPETSYLKFAIFRVGFESTARQPAEET